MKLTIVLFFLALLPSLCFGQGSQAELKFHEGSNLYINGNPQQALSAVQEGLKAEPGNRKLQALKKLLEDQKKEEEQKKKEEQQKNQDKKDQQNKDKKEQENKDKQDQQKKDQEKKEQEQKEKEQKEREEKEEQQKDQEEKEQQEKEKDKKNFDPEVEDKLKEMQIDPEKARMLLEAMRNQEIQYLQQRKREQTKRRDPSKPDW